MPDNIHWVYGILGLIMANAPFLFFHRMRHLMGVWCLLGILFIVFGIAIESRYGAIQDKAFSFYVILFLLFTLLSFPGFVMRFLKKR